MGETNHGNPDAVRNAIRSTNTMLISLPREVAMRAGIQRGVQVRVGQDIERPTIITMEVLNPMDLSAELKVYLDAAKTAADNKVEAAKKSAVHAEKMAASALKKEAKSVAAAKRLKETAEKAAEKAEKALAKVAKPKAEPKVAKVPKVKKPTAKEAGAILEARKAKAEEMGISPDLLQPDWRPGDAVTLGPEMKPE